MITISLCMIVKNEEDVIGRCLDCVKDIVDEIIIVDTGSTDRTKEIVSAYTSNIYDFEWIDDFSAARNYSFSKATKDYIMWLDADDVLLPEDIIKLKNLKENLSPSVDVVMMKYNLGVKEDGSPVCTYYRERLLKRSKGFKWIGNVHECIEVKGKIVTSDIAVTHKKKKVPTSRNLDIFEKLIKKGKKLSHRELFYYARELHKNGRSDEAIKYYEKFLDKEGGLLSNYVDACIDLYNIYKKREENKKALKSLLRSFEHGAPRAEICCMIGFYFKEQKDYANAIFWFKLAYNIEKPKISWGSILHDFYDYIPCIELCYCYFKTGNIKESIKYNSIAEKIRPGDKLVMHNKKFFEDILKKVVIK